MKSPEAKAASVVAAAGGKIVGRTRLQKTACLLELAGLGHGFAFTYHHYGPYSEELSLAVERARGGGLLTEDVRSTDWGGVYSVFQIGSSNTGSGKALALAVEAAKADAIELEFAVTAGFLAASGSSDPWLEVRDRKPDKATSVRLANAKALYGRLRKIKVPNTLPEIV